MSERLLRVRVQPRAPRSEIVGWRTDGTLSVRVAAPPVEGQANAALVQEAVVAKLDGDAV